MEKVKCETYSRVTGYIRPVSAWNPGKIQEHKDRSYVVNPATDYKKL